MLKVEVSDDDCGDNECHAFLLPLETSKLDIMASIECLYPTANDVRIYVVDKE